jgi:hypothetical protein
MDGFKLCGLIQDGSIPIRKISCDEGIFLINFDQYRKRSRDAEAEWYELVMEVFEGQRHGNPHDTFYPYIGIKNNNIIGGLFSPGGGKKTTQTILSDALCDDWELYISFLKNL